MPSIYPGVVVGCQDEDCGSTEKRVGPKEVLASGFPLDVPLDGSLLGFNGERISGPNIYTIFICKG